MSATVRRTGIRLEERDGPVATYNDPPSIVWVASFNARLSSGESLTLERSGDTAIEAYDNLEAAILEQGWTIA